MSKLRSYIINSLVVLVSLGVSLVIAEQVYRYYKYAISPNPTGGMVVATYQRAANVTGAIYSFDEDMNFQFKANVHYNNWAFRFPTDYSEHKAADEFRIAVVGDSYTESLTNDYSWVEVFSREIGKNASLKQALGKKKIVVGNFGNSGSDMQFMAGQLMKIKNLFKPDLAIIAFLDTDANRTKDKLDEEWTKPSASVEELVSSTAAAASMTKATVGNGLYSVEGAPDFGVHVTADGVVSRMVYFLGEGEDFVSDKALLKTVHRDLQRRVAYSGKIWLWSEFKQVFDQYWTRLKARKVREMTPQELEEKHRETYFEMFEYTVELARKAAPDVLLINLPTCYEVVDQQRKKAKPAPFIYWPDFLNRRRDIPAISLMEYLPLNKSYEEKFGWYTLPYDCHLSNKGADLYGKIVANVLPDYLAGDKHKVLVGQAIIDKEIKRFEQYKERKDAEDAAMKLILKAREAVKDDRTDEALELFTKALELNDDAGQPGTVYQERAMLWLKKNEAQKAYDDMSRALKKEMNPNFLKLRAEISLTLGKPDQTRADLDDLEKIATSKNDQAMLDFVALMRQKL